MILKEENVVQIEGDIQGEVIQSKINTEKLSKLFGMLSSLYRNVPGSIIREYCSNAVDSMRAAGKENEPIIVKLTQVDNGSMLSIKDTGLGMSPTTMKNIYFNYLDSTKEESDLDIGAFGIGGKSALAYTHTFYIDTIFDGILYHYIFTKQSNGIPAGELLYEEPTTDCNGTEIRIPIKNGDEKLFFDEFKKQLTYFPQVYIDTTRWYYNNDYKIFENNIIKYRNDTSWDELHISLGNVPYSIDWTELGIKAVEIPVAMIFNIGDLTPTPSRESIVYSKESINKIKIKIDEVKKFLTDKYNESIKFVNTFKEFYDSKGYVEDRRILINIADGFSLDIYKNELPYAKNIVIQDCENLGVNSKTMFKSLYLDYQFSNVSFSWTGKQTSFYSGIYNGLDFVRYARQLDKFYYRTGSLNKLKNEYITDKYNCSFGFIMPEKAKLEKYIGSNILSTQHKSKWRDIIKLQQKLSKEYIESITENYEDLEIPQDWLDSRKVVDNNNIGDLFKKRKSEQKIIIYKVVRGSNKPYIWSDSQEIKVKDLNKLATNIIYTGSGDKNTTEGVNLQRVINHLGLETKWKVIALATNNFKHLKDNPKAISYEEFMKGKNNIFRKIATAYQVSKILNYTTSLINQPVFKYVNEDIYNKYQYLTVFKNRFYYDSWASPREFYKQIYDIVKNNNELDEYKIKDAEEVIKYSDITKSIDNNINNYNQLDCASFIYLATRYYCKLPVNKYWYLKDEHNLAIKELKDKT